MITPSSFRHLVSGRQRGPGAMIMRGLLRAAEAPYAAAMRWRNRRYDRGAATVHRVAAPVVSVGNLTLGGTGKTPLVEWIARTLGDEGVKVANVSRGFGAAEGERNDEALELELALPGVPHVQNRDRVAAAQNAIDEFGAELVLVDDGFQHRRLARDLDIVLLDACEPFGFEHVFPRGTLREPVEGLRRADAIVLSRAEMLTPQERAEIERRAKALAPEALWCEVEHAPTQLVNSAGELSSIESLPGKRVAAFCGIGNPAGFRHTLAALGCEVTSWKEFPDHHLFTRAEIAWLAAWVRDAELVLCTRKDLVKLRAAELGGVALWGVGIALRFQIGEEGLAAELRRIVGGE